MNHSSLRMAYKSNQATFFRFAPQLPSRPRHPPGTGCQRKNIYFVVLEHTRGFTTGYTVPLEGATMTVGPAVAGGDDGDGLWGPIPPISFHPSHPSYTEILH